MSRSDINWPEDELAKATVQALLLWSDPGYEGFLRSSRLARVDISEQWFKKFTSAWNVARTIDGGKKEEAREYFNAKFQVELLRSQCPEKVVDRGAKYLQDKRYSSQTKKDGTASLPISIVSKVGFFIRPDNLVPFDRFAKDALNDLRRQSGLKRLKFDRYVEYFSEFETAFKLSGESIKGCIEQSWVEMLNKKIGGNSTTLRRIGFKRKVLDNLLVFRGQNI